MKAMKWISYFAIALDCPRPVIEALVHVPVKIHTARRSVYKKIASYFLNIVEAEYGTLKTFDPFELGKDDSKEVTDDQTTVRLLYYFSSKKWISASVRWDKFGNVHFYSLVKGDGLPEDNKIQLLAFCWKDQLKAERAHWSDIR
jgi:hypothetical protein